MPQIARPNADISNDGWTPTPLWSTIRAGGSVESEPYPTSTSFIVGLDSLLWTHAQPQVLTVEITTDEADAAIVTVTLLQDTNTIAGTAVVLSGTGTQVATLTLTQQQIDAITDYSQLRVSVMVNACCGGNGSHGTDIFYTTTTWTAPVDVDCVTVQAWGDGGGGGGPNSTGPSGGNGGGGGGYSVGTVPVTGLQEYTVGVGAGGAGGSEFHDGSNGEGSGFTGDDGYTVSAGGGSGGAYYPGSGGAGTFTGGTGGTTSGTTSGGGGAAAGSGANGANGQNGSAGGAGGVGSGGGGSGGYGSPGGGIFIDGGTGSVPGGGGGGGNPTDNKGPGGDGGPGMIILSW